MREFIKKFESAILADGYVIKDIPFTTSVATDPIQNLVCNKTGKHLENNNDKVIICPQDISNNEIWYWGEYYDLKGVIEVLSQQVPYKYPAILSNEKVGDKYVITFDGPVTKLGAVLTEEPGELYPIFMNNPDSGILCNITYIKIPDSVTNMSYVFQNCSSLTSINIPDSVTSIGERTFYYCSGLTSVTIPNSVTSIGREAFSGCSGLTSIEIPNSVTSIDGWAFYGCSGLTSLTIGNSVTSIGTYAFYGCTGLTSVTIPNSVTNIEACVFMNCNGLISVIIPNSVTNIGKSAFNSCYGLTSMTCEAITPPTLDVYVFDSTNNCPIYVPAESVDVYKTATNWSTYADRIQAIP